MYTKIQTGIWNKWDHLTMFNSQFLTLKNVHLDLMVRKPGVCLQASHFTFPTATVLYSNSQFSSVKSLSHVWLFATPWTAARQASLSITNSRSSLKPMSIVGDAIQPSQPLSSLSPPALNLPQHQGLLKWVSSSHQVAKVLEFQLQHQSHQWTPRTDLL